MRYALLLLMFLSASSARAGTLHVYGPGCPAPEWKILANKNADLIFSGSESMMTDLLPPGRRIMVLQGSGQGGLWEDFAKWGWMTGDGNPAH